MSEDYVVDVDYVAKFATAIVTDVDGVDVPSSSPDVDEVVGFEVILEVVE